MIEWSQEVQDNVREVLAPIYEEWMAEMSEQGIDGAAMLAAAGVTMN